MSQDQSIVVRHQALLIGNCFTPHKRREEWPPLKGCIQDVQMIKKKLVNSIPGIHVHTLTADVSEEDTIRPFSGTGELPTHSNILSRLERIALNASPGTFVYIHFTGHGTAIEPISPYAKSSTGELALVALASDDVTNIQYLRGSELAYWLKKFVENDLKVTLVLDCCASGSVVRDKKDPAARYLPYDAEIDRAHPPASGQSLSIDDEANQPAFRGASMRPNWLVNPDGYTVLTACGPNQEAQELQIGTEVFGALSYFLIRTFDKLGHVGGRLQHIYAHLCARFRESGMLQRPMLYGNRRLYFFEDTNYDDDAILIPITKTLGQKFQLEAGQAHGVCEDDVFALRPSRPIERNAESEHNPILFRAAHVRDLTSELEISDRIPSTSGMTAMARTRLSLRNFPIVLDVPQPWHNIWEVAKRERLSLTIQHANTALHDTSFSFHVIVLAKDAYEIRDEFDRLIPDLPLSPYDLSENADYVLDIVEHLTQFKLVEELNNPNLTDTQHPFREAFDIYLLDTAGNVHYPSFSQSEHFVEVNHGGMVELVVQNKAGEGGDELYLHFYNLDSCWEIKNLIEGDYDVIPPCSSNQDCDDFVDGTSGVWRQELQMVVPDELRAKGKTQCDDIFKILITLQSTSFMLFELPQIGEPYQGSRTARERGDSDSSPAVPEYWAALNIRIRTSLT